MARKTDALMEHLISITRKYRIVSDNEYCDYSCPQLDETPWGPKCKLFKFKLCLDAHSEPLRRKECIKATKT